jgi:hypothetical protein
MPVDIESKLESSCSIGEKANFMRKKLILQSKRKDFRFPKEKMEKVGGSKNLEPPTGHAISSIIEPVIIDIDETKRTEHTFGKFLTKNKRNASRRYKTLVRDDVLSYKSELSKMYSNNTKEQSTKNMRVETEGASFLDGNMYAEEGIGMKFERKNANGSESVLSRAERKESTKKVYELPPKRSKKSSGL